MQFTRVDEDAYDVRMNLDTIKRISESMTYIGSDNPVDDNRNQAIAAGFGNAHKRFSEPDPEIVESSEE